MGIKTVYISFILSLVVAIQGYAQVNRIEVITRAQEDKILLRWAPTNFVSWHYLNEYGYTIERYTVTKDSVMVNPPVKIILHPIPLKPKPLNDWEALVDENDYAAIAAQVIYGETLELSGNKGNDITQIVYITKEQQQRFSFALLAADQSFQVAEMSGLGFIDLNARKEEKYLYKIISNVPDSIAQINEGTAFVGLKDHIPLPEPIDLEAEFGDQTVILKWNRSFFERIYNSFMVEKSEDGGAIFLPTTDKPIVNTYQEDQPIADYYYGMDSLAENGKIYHYRVRGRTPFGETGPPSEVIKGMGKIKFQLDIGIAKAYGVNNEKVVIDWEVVDGTVDIIKEYLIERSNNSDGTFSRVNEKTIGKETLSYVDEAPHSTNYYRVSALSIYDDKLSSFPYLVQLEDSIPPSIPINLEGYVDSTGIVTVSWHPNTESDLLGYRVYRSNFKNAEFGQITTEPVLEPNFTDSISINTLTSSIYYKVMAVDRRFNPSLLSEAVALQRPDIIPPVAPVFKSIKSVEEGIAIEWINSSSADVAAHVIYKNKTGEKEWKLFQAITIDTVQSLIDDDVQAGIYYNYTMVAVDSAKLQSLPANSVRGIKVDTGVRPIIEKIKTIVDRTNKTISIMWEYNEENVKEFLIYKKIEEEQLSLYRNISGNDVEFTDTKLVINTNYLYRIKAVYSDGSESPFSNEVKIKY